MYNVMTLCKHKHTGQQTMIVTNNVRTLCKHKHTGQQTMIVTYNVMTLCKHKHTGQQTMFVTYNVMHNIQAIFLDSLISTYLWNNTHNVSCTNIIKVCEIIITMHK